MIFSSVGHFYVHMMTAFYFVIVLTLVVKWNEPYSELLQLGRSLPRCWVYWQSRRAAC